MKPFPFSLFACICLFISCSEPLPPVTRDEALKIGDSIATSINAHQQRVLGKYFDAKLFLERISDHGSFAGLDAYVGSLGSKVNGQYLAREIFAKLDNNGYQLLRVYEKNGVQHLLFRMISEQQLNYHDFELVRTKTGIRIPDMFVYFTGENLSLTLWEGGRAMNEATDFLGRVRPENRALINLKTLQKEGKFAEIKKLIEEADTVLRNSRLLQVTYITACQQLGDSIYLTALQQYQRRFPDAANVSMLMIDAYAMNKKYTEGLNAINHLDSLVGGDPYLNLHRSNLYALLNDREQARSCLLKANNTDPHLVPAVDALVQMHVEDGEISNARKVLTAYDSLPDHDNEFVEAVYEVYPFLKN